MSKEVLITTFTQENENEIRSKFKELNKGVIPRNVTIKTWFSFLIGHGVKPYQGTLINNKINGLLLVSEQSGLKYKGKGRPIFYPEIDVEKHYFSKDYKIYSDKISKFTVKSNELSKGKVINRISKIFDYIFIDEIQDLAGYDLDIIKMLMQSQSKIIMVGDPRQVTYYTHFSRKYSKYKNGNIVDFIKKECINKKLDCIIDEITLKDSWRNNQLICDVSNRVFLNYLPNVSLHKEVSSHDGVFFVKSNDIEHYLEKYKPLQLRDTRRKKVNENYPVLNFGESKGKTVKRALIYPTKPILSWFEDHTSNLAFSSRCKLYVALTRAIHSVAIVCDKDISVEGISNYYRSN
ncbi:UvrD-helicase domain-containing protein [Sporosarcina sp. E16_8]|nr:UvrD-helicase domain-containing protein [Sporosarcina sp. E16_8]